LAERLDTGVYGEEFVGAAAPEKSFIQLHRRVVTAGGAGVMLLAVALTERSLHGSAAGLVLYGLGSLAITSAVLGRLWCYVYNAGNRDRVVITEGPYSLCRNPIYGFSILASAGVGLIAQSLLLAVLFGGAATLFYLHIIRGEEAKMSHLHGATYERYLGTTQRMIPSLARLDPATIEHLPGAKFARKLPKLAAIGLAFPLVELCNEFALGVWSIF
jgi:protein-S-isoprenylcysteine O-methyltransferase Ste14